LDARICSELRERFAAFQRRDLYEIRLAALFLDATFLAVRPNGPKEGVLVAWGFSTDGERVLLAVMLGMRESHEDWLALARDLSRRRSGRARCAPALPDPTSPAMAKHQPARAIARRGQAPHQSDRPLPRRDQLPHARLGRP
jgi:hypothetical protein